MDIKYVEFFELLPKTAQLTIRMLVPTKYERIGTMTLVAVLVQQGALSKIVCDHLTDSSDAIVKRVTNNKSDKHIHEFSDLDITEECQLVIDNVLFFKNRYNDKIDSSMLTTYLTYFLLTTPELECHKFFVDCVDVRYYTKVIDNLCESLNTFTGCKLSATLGSYGEYMTNPLRMVKYTCFGRDKEIQDSLDILSRMKKNNVILVGNAGVGKTTIVEGICNILQSENCPPSLRAHSVFALDSNKVISGTMYRGDMEKRMEEILSELKLCKNTILFIDELHTIFNKPTGDNDGSSIQQMLKTYLSTSSKVIGCTTNEEYKTIETDKAFERRFSIVRVPELSKNETVETLLKCKNAYEEFHSVKVNKELCEYIVDNCETYIKTRFFPDKAFDILDIASVVCKNDNRQEIQQSDVDSAVYHVSGINPKSRSLDYIKDVQNKLKERIIGQDNAVDSICRNIKRYYIGVNNKKKPIGSYLFVGPTGTGKTELCIQLAKHLFSSECFIRYDMSEFMEPHSVSKLIGAPPGYVGFNTGNTLAEFVKHNPFCIILFDEIEKAHKDVINTLLQIMDYGSLTDAKGQKVDCCNTLIVMTSNVGCRQLLETNNIGFNNDKKDSGYLTKYINEFFSPEFRNRLDGIIVFNQITKTVYEKIFNKELDKIVNVYKSQGIDITVDNKAKKKLMEDCYDDKNGVRFVQRKIATTLDNLVLDIISDKRKPIKISFNKEYVAK